MILIVEDSKIQRVKLTKILVGAGFTVVEAENGRDALDKLESVKPKVILTDLLMPEMDGIQLLEALVSKKCSIPVVVLSADIQDSTRQRCSELGVAAFITKPAQPEQFLTVLGKLVASESAC